MIKEFARLIKPKIQPCKYELNGWWGISKQVMQPTSIKSFRFKSPYILQ